MQHQMVERERGGRLGWRGNGVRGGRQSRWGGGSRWEIRIAEGGIEVPARMVQCVTITLTTKTNRILHRYAPISP